MIIKILGSEVSCNSTASNFSSARLVRIVNKNNTVHTLITQAYSNSTVIGTLTIRANSDVLLEKGMTDTIISNNNSDVVAVSVAYKN